MGKRQQEKGLGAPLPENCRDAFKYALDVSRGEVHACKWTIAACERHMRDVENHGFQHDSGGRFYFDVDAAEEAVEFIQNLPHVKGEWARRRELLVLEPWQKFLVTSIFGWKTKSGTRRFRTAYVEVPRKNGKSALATGVALYMLVADGEHGAEVYSAATTRDQAKIVFQDAQKMVKRDPDFQTFYETRVTAHAVVCDSLGGTFQALSADGSTLDGLGVHCAIIDELHAHKTREVYDVVETGTGSRAQPLLFLITTAGTNRSGICYEVRTYLTKVLQEIAEDDTFFGVIWTIDDGDDWTLEESWKKANPNYGVSLYPDDFARLARKAMEMPSATNNFLTKRLNVWVNADTAWMDMRAWDRCADDTLCIEDFAGMPCWVALDLASKVDIAAMTMLFKKEVDGKEHYYVFGKYYLPETAVEDGRNSQYSGWARDGRLVVTPGPTIDYEYIKSDIRLISSLYEVREVPYDPFQATQFSVEMLGEGFPMVEMRPTVLNFSDPMKELEKLVLEGKLHHDGCPALTWMVSNVVCHLDAKDNIYPRKERPENKIDGAVSLIMALGRATIGAGPQAFSGGVLDWDQVTAAASSTE